MVDRVSIQNNQLKSSSQLEDPLDLTLDFRYYKKILFVITDLGTHFLKIYLPFNLYLSDGAYRNSSSGMVVCEVCQA